MLELILGILSSGGFGALTGIIGAWITKRETRRVLEIENQHTLAMRELDQREREAEMAHELSIADKQVERARVEGDIALQTDELDAFKASIETQRQPKSALMDAFLSFVRPLITFALLWESWILLERLNTLVGGLQSLPADVLMDIYKHAIYAVIFLATTAVGWWFGTRPDRGLMGGIKRLVDR